MFYTNNEMALKKYKCVPKKYCDGLFPLIFMISKKENTNISKFIRKWRVANRHCALRIFKIG
jgi:hypothetical protein